MKSKDYERRSVVGNMGIGIVLVVVIFVGYVVFTANPKEMLQQMQEKREVAAWNTEVASLISNGEMEAAMNMATGSVYELTEENAEAIEAWKTLVAQKEADIANALGQVRDTYLAGDKESAVQKLYSLSSSYPDSAYVKAYMELVSSVEKKIEEADMYDWKYGGKPGYGTYKDFRGNAITGFCFSSYYTSNGEYGYFDTKSYTQVTITADCIAIGSETLPIIITDTNTGEEYTIYCPKGSVSETLEITGGDIQISTLDDSADSYGSAVINITVSKELTEVDFEEVDVRF